MKYPCDMIRDLLPLFCDGVCSEASAEAVREHLAACADCRAIHEQLISGASVTLPAADDDEAEMKKAAALRKMRRIVITRRILMVLLALVLAAGIWLWNDHGEMFMPPQDSMKVFYDEEGNLVLLSDLPCNGVNINQILIPETVDGQQKNHVFVRYFCRPLEYSWGKLTGYRSDNLYVLGFAEKGAQEIDAVHFVTKDFESSWFRSDIPITQAELETYIGASVTLWEKE